MSTDPDGGWCASILFEALYIKDFDHESARMDTNPDGLQQDFGWWFHSCEFVIIRGPNLNSQNRLASV